LIVLKKLWDFSPMEKVITTLKYLVSKSSLLETLVRITIVCS